MAAIPKRTQHYTEIVLQGLRRGWSVAKICAMGKAGLTNIGDEPDPNFPARVTVFDWLGVDRQFAALYLEARRAGCEAMVDEGIVIVDNSADDTDWVVDENGELHKVVDHEHVNRSRLRADYRKWYVAKLVPRLYGERVEVEHKGNIDVVTSRLSEGRQRALGAAPSALTDERGAERTLPAAIEGTYTVVHDDGSELV